MKKLLLLISISALLPALGCTYAISRDVARNADASLTFEAISREPETYQGKLVILGGMIVRTTALNQGTLIEVSQKPLDYWGKPRRTTATGGTFLIVYPAALAPLRYAPGREITVAGQIEGTRSKTLGDAEYGYPILLSKELKLWPLERPPLSRPDYLDPLYDPYTSPRQY
jgi:outer membrane lipoprotein